MTRDDARALDAADPLARFRDRFVLPEGVIYLDGNSLGALPVATPGIVADLTTRQWGDRLIRSWNEGWIDAPARIGGKIAALIGAGADRSHRRRFGRASTCSSCWSPPCAAIPRAR